MWLRPDTGSRRVLRVHATLARHEPAPRAQQRPAQETSHDDKILIADDEPNILISLEFLMKREGYEVQRRARRRGGAGRAAARAAATWCCST